MHGTENRTFVLVTARLLLDHTKSISISFEKCQTWNVTKFNFFSTNSFFGVQPTNDQMSPVPSDCVISPVNSSTSSLSWSLSHRIILRFLLPSLYHRALIDTKDKCPVTRELSTGRHIEGGHLSFARHRRWTHPNLQDGLHHRAHAAHLSELRWLFNHTISIVRASFANVHSLDSTLRFGQSDLFALQSHKRHFSLNQIQSPVVTCKHPFSTQIVTCSLSLSLSLVLSIFMKPEFAPILETPRDV